MTVPLWLPARARRRASFVGATLMAGTALVAPQKMSAHTTQRDNSHVIVI